MHPVCSVSEQMYKNQTCHRCLNRCIPSKINFFKICIYAMAQETLQISSNFQFENLKNKWEKDWVEKVLPLNIRQTSFMV